MTLADIITNDNIRFIFAGGKGGVGKTSTASAIAIKSAELGFRTLVLSTDPAHSLSDSLNQDISGGEIIPVEGVPNLYGLELNTEKALEETRSYLSMQMEGQLPGFEDLTSLTPPGSDEAMAFAKVLEFIENPQFDRIVFDTAPTGHTLRLLSLPEMLDSWVGKLITFRMRLSSAFSAIKRMFGSYDDQEDNSLEMLQEMKRRITVARAELTDPRTTSFVIVMIPEAMSVFETDRLLAALNEYMIPVNHIVINMVYPENPSCPFCTARYNMQQKNLKDILELYEGYDIIQVPLFPEEVRGLEKLLELAKILMGKKSL